MNDDRQARIIAALRDLFDAIAIEVRSNPAFAGKVQAALLGTAAAPPAVPAQPAGPAQSAMNALRGASTAAAPARPVSPVLAAIPAAMPLPPPGSKDPKLNNSLLQNVTFDPLECHIEAALLSGREHEARLFLSKLDRWQLEEVVKAQRLPGTRNLQKAIFEGDTASAVDAIMSSAFERIRSRLSTAR
jgi:hypothetical protein